jgi:hypothetical protein
MTTYRQEMRLEDYLRNVVFIKHNSDDEYQQNNSTLRIPKSELGRSDALAHFRTSLKSYEHKHPSSRPVSYPSITVSPVCPHTFQERHVTYEHDSIGIRVDIKFVHELHSVMHTLYALVPCMSTHIT